MTSTPTKFRKKPVVIEAMQFDGTTDSACSVLAWISDNGGSAVLRRRDVAPTWLAIHTLEGTMSAETGDYVIRGVQGEFYPCKPDIFAATYDVVEA